MKIAKGEPPHSEESEIAVLGSIMLRPTILDTVSGILSPGDFYRANHRTIYQAMLDMSKGQQAIDVVTLSERLTTQKKIDDVGGIEFLSELTDVVPTSHNAKSYAQTVRQKAVLRSVIEHCWTVLDWAHSSTAEPSKIIGDAQDALFRMLEGQQTERGVLDIRGVMREAMDSIDRVIDRKGASSATTGFASADRILTELPPGEMTIIAGDSGHGKTALLLNILEHNAARGVNVLLFSLETTAASIGTRIITQQTGIARKDFYTDDSLRDITGAIEAIQRRYANFYIDDNSNPDVGYIHRKVREMASRGLGPAIVAVDYVQLMDPGASKESRERAVNEASRGLKHIAKSCNLNAIGLSQLNDERRKKTSPMKRRPGRGDLRESKAIFHHAYQLMTIWRPEADYLDDGEEDDCPAEWVGMGELGIIKNKDGALGRVKLRWRPEMMRFEDPASDEQERQAKDYHNPDEEC